MNEFNYIKTAKSRLSTPLSIDGRISKLHQKKHSTKGPSPYKLNHMQDIFL